MFNGVTARVSLDPFQRAVSSSGDVLQLKKTVHSLKKQKKKSKTKTFQFSQNVSGSVTGWDTSKKCCFPSHEPESVLCAVRGLFFLC